MSKLTLDEAIKHCLEVAEQNEKKAEYRPRMDYYDEIESRTDCRECAADHRQLAEWLMDYKDLKAEQNDQYVFIHELMSELTEAKRLLSAAVEDIKDMLPHTDSCDDCALNKDDAHDCSNSTLNCDVKCKWRYADEALKLINDEK